MQLILNRYSLAFIIPANINKKKKIRMRTLGRKKIN